MKLDRSYEMLAVPVIPEPTYLAAAAFVRRNAQSPEDASLLLDVITPEPFRAELAGSSNG